MNWIILLLTSTFALQCLANQETSEIIRSTILRQNLSDKNLRLDPLLRKALLKALVELEKEAEEKLRAEETRSIRSEPSDSIGNFVQSVEDDKQEVPGPAETGFPVPRANEVNQGVISEEPRNNIQNVQNIQENQNAQNVETVQETVKEIDQTKIQNDFQYSTTPSVPEQIGNLVETAKSQDTVIQSSIESNFIPDDINKGKNVVEGNDLRGETKKQEEGNKEGKKTDEKGNEVDIFKAPLVAAFTLHQDSKGTPHSVIPLFSKQQQINNQQRQQFLEHQYALYKQQQQQQYLQNQFIPSVALTPFSPQINQFDQSRYFIAGAPNFSPSTVFPPLVTNSIIPQSFTPIPTQTFDATTLPPFKASQPNFLATLPPQRNFSPEPFGQTILPGQDFNGVSVVQSHSINLTPAPQNFPLPTVTPSPRLQPLNIPPVTLPLQNEARFQTPIIVPSVQQNPNQAFLDSQEQERIRNRILAEEQNRKRLIEEQNRQRQIQEQNRQRQLEEERQRQIYESQIRLRQQRQEQGVDFQRSVGFTFNQNTQSFRPSSFRSHQNGFNFHIQPSQSFVSSVNFANPLNHNRVNRQEGFASTGNFGFNNNNQGNRNFDNRFQYQSNQIYTKIPEYRTIPDEHYRNLQINQYQQNNRFQQYNQQQQQQQQYLQQQQYQQQQQQYQQQQYQQQFNNFGRNNVDDVNKRLQSLLYQSGVATDASGQEDLNIVSKVLALNHERSDSDVSETVLQNNHRSESPKSLAVGEIKEADRTTE